MAAYAFYLLIFNFRIRSPLLEPLLLLPRLLFTSLSREPFLMDYVDIFDIALFDEFAPEFTEF